jgi:hypothetical protein
LQFIFLRVYCIVLQKEKEKKNPPTPFLLRKEQATIIMARAMKTPIMIASFVPDSPPAKP